MASLRTVFGRLFLLNEEEKKKLSDRELDILRLCVFLKPFMRSNKTIDSGKPDVSSKPDASTQPNETTKNDDGTANAVSANYSIVEEDNPDQRPPSENLTLSVNPPPILPSLIPPTPPVTFWGEYLNILKSNPKSEFHLHEHWARGLAEKLKFFDALKAEQIKHRLDGIVLEYIEEMVENRL